MTWFDKILEFLKEFWPFSTIDQNEMGVRLRCGKFRGVLKPGLYWRWWLVDEIYASEVVEQVVNLPNQSVGTLAFSLTIRYEIEDIKKAILEVQDFDIAIQNVAMSIAGETVAHRQDISLADLQSTILNELSGEAEEWGINIMDVGITDFAKHKVLRLMCHDVPLSSYL